MGPSSESSFKSGEGPLRPETFKPNLFVLVLRLPTRPARQRASCQERLRGIECVSSAAFITVSHKDHEPIHPHAAAAARHDGRTRDDG